MAFVVAHGHEDGPQTLWVLFKYDEDRTTIEYTVFEQDSVHWIFIRCYATEDRQSTQAKITYTYVGASEPACHRNERHLQAPYRPERLGDRNQPLPADRRVPFASPLARHSRALRRLNLLKGPSKRDGKAETACTRD